jgi:hypothetical protein
MKTIRKILLVSALAIALPLLFSTNAKSQTNLQFTSINATDEGAIQLFWESQPNHLYEIDEADALVDTNTGSITWNKLYDNYPSHGTNTFIGDFGNYNLTPQILHPKNSPMRFYRVVDKGAEAITDEPLVSIASPTNEALVSGELAITVTVSTVQPVLSGIKLYVDGQEMPMADNITNYTDGLTNYETDIFSINTCEWENGTHVLFATVECESGYADIINSGRIVSGHGVSPSISVIFNNLVTRISFSQPLFDPASGQTQQVSAVFPLNSDWTLHIVDVYSNVVQTATGSGISMLYNWDGTSNGTNLPNGLYYYYITAQTNGLARPADDGGSGEGGGSPPPPSFDSEISELWAMSGDNSDAVVPLLLYPPGFDTNGLTIFSASLSEIRSLETSALGNRFSSTGGGSFSTDSIGDPGYVTPLPNPQSGPVAPQRPPNNPVKGLAGTFGVAYDSYSGNGTNGYVLPPLDNGLHVHINIPMNNFPATNMVFAINPAHKAEADAFINQMQHWGWNNTFLKADDQLSINDLRGSGTPFNNVNLGVLLVHGSYGTGQNALDYAANQCKQMYFPITSGGSAQYLRLSEMNLGGGGTNGLKWFANYACHSLQHDNWANMQSKGVKPYNSNLHLLLGADTDSYTSPALWWYWAKYMNFGTSTNYSPLTLARLGIKPLLMPIKSRVLL